MEQTATAVTYLDILQLYLLSYLEDHQQDGAPPQWACQRISLHAFSWSLGWHGGPILWPLLSPDITPRLQGPYDLLQ